MDKRFANIKVLIWDFDGTFYKPIPDLWKEIRRAEYKTIANHTGWKLNKIIKEFNRIHLTKFQSATAVTAYLSKISIPQAASEMEEYFDRTKYVKRDERLIDLFNKLNNFRNFTLANGVTFKHLQTLKVLGLSPKIFESMVTSEIVGTTKPDENGFRYIMKITKLPANQHLMIGDREKVDLVPAKKLGMKTCLVWSDKKSEIADVTLKNIYDLKNILL